MYLSTYRRQSWTPELINKAKKSLALKFNGDDDFVVVYDETTHKVTATKRGVTIELNFDSVGYNGNVIDLNVESGYRRINSKTIGRISTKTDLSAPRLRREFRDYANSKIDEILTEQITKPAKAKSQVSSAKAFEQWKKTNADFIKHESVYEVGVDQTGYYDKESKSIGTDHIITDLRAYYSDKYPNNTQLFGIIVKSGIKVHRVESNHVKVIGNGEETTNFLKLLNSPLEWD